MATETGLPWRDQLQKFISKRYGVKSAHVGGSTASMYIPWRILPWQDIYNLGFTFEDMGLKDQNKASKSGIFGHSEVFPRAFEREDIVVGP